MTELLLVSVLGKEWCDLRIADSEHLTLLQEVLNQDRQLSALGVRSVLVLLVFGSPDTCDDDHAPRFGFREGEGGMLLAHEDCSEGLQIVRTRVSHLQSIQDVSVEDGRRQESSRQASEGRVRSALVQAHPLLQGFTPRQASRDLLIRRMFGELQLLDRLEGLGRMHKILCEVIPDRGWLQPDRGSRLGATTRSLFSRFLPGARLR